MELLGNEGPNGEFVITSNWNRVDAGHDIVVANPRNKLFVDDNSSDTNPGTQTTPFKTIQKGIDEVSGSTVNIAAGTYDEQVVIDGRS